MKPYDFCISSSARVQIYSAQTQTLKKTISRFQDVATFASFRRDGKLIVAGDASGSVQIFDLGSRAILRTFDAHSAAVRSCRFLPSNTQICSVSDDKTVKIWDITSQMATHCFTGHEDYVRSLAVSSSSSNIVTSSSYDGSVKVWDLRANQCVFNLDHNGLPVESVVCFPGDSMIASAAGSTLYVWDLLGGLGNGRLLHSANNHQKTITNIAFNRSHSRLLTSSLDHQVKIMNVSDFTITHSIKYPSPILSVALSPDDEHLVTGMVSGLLCIKKKKAEVAPVIPDALKVNISPASVWALGAANAQEVLSRHELDMKSRPGTAKFFLRGRHKMPSSQDLVVKFERKQKILEFESHLKQFEYAAALDSVFARHTSPEIVVTLLDELRSREKGMFAALKGRDDISLEPIFKFILRHIKDPRFTDTLISSLNVLLDVHSATIYSSPVLEILVEKILKKSIEEVRLQKDLHGLVGVMDMIIGFAEAIKQ